MMPPDPSADNVEPPPLSIEEDMDYQTFGKRACTDIRPMGPQFDVPADALMSETGGKKRYHRNTAFFTKRLDQLVLAGFDDPMQVLMEIASGFKLEPDPRNSSRFMKVPLPKIDAKSRALAATELLSYVYPKRKSVEVTGAEGAPIGFTLGLDQTPIPEMPSDKEIEAIALERRQRAAENARTLEGRQ
jgi:hypothetical protein